MIISDIMQANEHTRSVWNTNAAFWNERMGDEGNDFVNMLIWPATERLLQLQPGQRVLDIACGNGLYARRLVAAGAEVVAFDFAAEMIEIAQSYETPRNGSVDYHVIDATDEEALLALGPDSFDVAICQMALFDMAEIQPLLKALPILLKATGRFVFSLMHPCFNNPSIFQVAEMEDRDGEVVTTYAVKVRGYMSASTDLGLAIDGQPEAQFYFHRPLQMILGAMFEAGFVMDALEERAFPPDVAPGRHPLGWSGKFSEIPPVLMARMRPS